MKPIQNSGSAARIATRNQASPAGSTARRPAAPRCGCTVTDIDDSRDQSYATCMPGTPGSAHHRRVCARRRQQSSHRVSRSSPPALRGCEGRGFHATAVATRHDGCLSHGPCPDQPLAHPHRGAQDRHHPCPGGPGAAQARAGGAGGRLHPEPAAARGRRRGGADPPARGGPDPAAARPHGAPGAGRAARPAARRPRDPRPLRGEAARRLAARVLRPDLPAGSSGPSGCSRRSRAGPR